LGAFLEGLCLALPQVKVSARLATSPAIVLTSKYGWSANMERIMKSQALGDTADRSYMKGMKTLEINPRHPLILELKRQVSSCCIGLNSSLYSAISGLLSVGLF
jgi:HSP90 family molecular chaperone